MCMGSLGNGTWPWTTALSLGFLMSVSVGTLGVFGCGGGASSEAKPSADDAQPPAQSPGAGADAAGSGASQLDPVSLCRSLSAERCEDHTQWPRGVRCSPVLGTLYEDARRCQDNYEIAGCMEAPMQCADARTAALVFAADPTGRTWQITYPCMPNGWTVIHPQDGQYSDWPPCVAPPPPPFDCGALSIEQCKTESRCAPIGAGRVDETRNCVGEGGYVGCGLDTGGGGNCQTACARDPSGQMWYFGSTTGMPRDWPTVACPHFDPFLCSTL